MDYVIDQIPVGMSMETRKGLKKFAYQLVTIADWACGAHDYRQLLSEHWSLALCAATFLLCFSLTLIHALRHGGRYIYLWQSTFFFGIIREISNVYLFPNANFCWHGQTLLTFFGRRIPAYVLFCLYPTFVYSSLVIVKRLKLHSPAECFLVALCSTVARIPYEILGTKLVWFTWHTDHPFVKQKLYHIPLSVVVLYFWSVACFVAFLHLSQRLLLPPLYNWKLFAREIACCWLAAICGPLVGYLLFENAFVLSHWLFSNGTIGVLAMSQLICFHLLIFGYFTRQPAKASAVSCVELNVAWLLQCVCFLIIAFAVRPEEIVSTGLHQPIGRCGTRIATPAMLLSGFEMERFMCPRLVESYEFDFHCTRAPSEHKPIEWYTICGKAFEKHAEFVLVLLWIMTAVTAAQVNWCWPFKNGGKKLSKDKDE
ncbi:hypothetical protein D918_08705 [Trichuris suis]|uniref:DUF7802 domain-containing protein n=1 Tax=Trichuris suis TaxID=68888 RepID=A0A085M314_9BILA|nr:hypothetical protein M513_07489 [Trichuris suis]KHJ41253.1 hypothetical protein D918_08705 [Trichuris suis]